MLFATLIGAVRLGAAPLNITAAWRGEPDALQIEIWLGDIMGPRQVKLIQSGFATLSELTMYVVKGQEKPLARLRCHVVFDPWEENYRVTLLAENGRSEQKTVKTFERYAALCLHVQIPVDARLSLWPKDGGVIQGSLQVNQLSGEQKEHLREWLVKQQSGMMQELFAHMLGDISITEDLEVAVAVAPYVHVLKPREGTP